MQKSEPRYFFHEGLDSFRGIGILWIICCHYFPGINFFRFGWVSLEFFFVLSGFLITKVLLHSAKNKSFFFNFYSRRALRIFPIYFAFLLVFFTVIFLFSKPQHFSFYKHNYAYFVFYLQNFLFVFKGIGKENHLSHLWSLAMEEQFYFFWPLVIFYIRDIKKIRKILWFVIVFAITLRIIVWWYWGERFEIYHCNTFTRADTIAFGCLLGCGFSFNRIKKPLRIVAISFSLLVFIIGLTIFKNPFFTNPLFCTLGYSAFSFLGVSFLEYFMAEKTKFRFLKTTRVLNYLGRISYSMYLFHLPLFLVLSPKTGFSQTENGILCLGISVALAAISYKFFEIKFLNLKKYFPRS